MKATEGSETDHIDLRLTHEKFLVGVRQRRLDFKVEFDGAANLRLRYNAGVQRSLGKITEQSPCGIREDDVRCLRTLPFAQIHIVSVPIHEVADSALPMLGSKI